MSLASALESEMFGSVRTSSIYDKIIFSLGWAYLWLYVLHNYNAYLHGRDKIYSFLSWSENHGDRKAIWTVICSVIWIEMTFVHFVLYLINCKLNRLKLSHKTL